MTVQQQLTRCRARNRMLQQQLSMRQTTPSGNHYLEHLFDKLAGEYNERIARLNTQKLRDNPTVIFITRATKRNSFLDNN